MEFYGNSFKIKNPFWTFCELLWKRHEKHKFNLAFICRKRRIRVFAFLMQMYLYAIIVYRITELLKSRVNYNEILFRSFRIAFF